MKKIILLLSVLVFFTACNPALQKPNSSKSGAEAVKQIDQVPKNGSGLTIEQANIKERIKVTTDPTKILWIHLISMDGKIIRRMALVGKVTSSGKRLEPRRWAGDREWSGQAPPSYSGYQTDEYLQPDGTFGSSDPYIFWFDPQGRYHQWGTEGSLGYLITDYPIDLENPIDKITGLYNMQTAAREWQLAEEKKLKK